MLNTNEIIMLVAAGFTWSATFLMVFRTQKANKKTLKMWLFPFCFSLAVTTQIDFVHTAIASYTQINNLAWFLSYIFGVIGLYFIIDSLYATLKLPVNIWRPRIALFTALILLAILFPSLAQLPDNTNHAILSTWTELLLVQVTFTYGAFLCFFVSISFFKLQIEEHSLAIRLRWLVVAAAAFAGGIFSTIRLIFTLIVYNYPSAAEFSIMLILLVGSRIAFLISAVGWPLFFMPFKFFKMIERAIEFLGKLLAWRELRKLCVVVEQLCPPIVPQSSYESMWQLLSNLEFYLYRTLIVILDGKKTLSSREIGTNQEIQLFHLLNTVDDTADYESLVLAYRDVGKHFRKGATA